ncbi:MAG: anti-sigma factor [Cyanobacteria bacterium J06639_18]
MERVELPQDWETLLAGYVLGNLTPYEVTKVKEYLANYPELTTQVNKLQTTLGLFSLSLPKNSSTKPSESLRSRILQAAENEFQREKRPFQENKEETVAYEEQVMENIVQETGYPEQEIQRFSPSSRRWRSKQVWLGLAGSAAAGLIAVLGFSNYRLHRELLITKSHLSQSQQRLELSQLKQELATTRQNLSRYEETLTLLKEPDNRLLSLKGTTPSSDYSGSLIIAPNSQSAVLSLQNLSALPAEKVYRLWAFVDGKKIKCAKFTPDSEGKVLQQIPLKQWGSTTEVFVTIEPKEGFTLPSGETVMKGTTI